MTLGNASFLIDDPNASTGSGVNIEATFDNNGTSTRSFNESGVLTQLVLVQGGNNYVDPTEDANLPQVPGTLSQAGMITFSVNSNFSFEDAFLLVGNPAYDQPRVPLGPGGGELLSYEPQPLTVSGTLSAGPSADRLNTITITGGEVRADAPTSYQEAAKGRLLLNILFSATTTSQSGTNFLRDSSFALAMPDGTGAGPGIDSVDTTLAIGATIPGLTLDFDVNNPPQPGTYTLTLTYEDASGRLTFQIP